jgi:hypothetical protein
LKKSTPLKSCLRTSTKRWCKSTLKCSGWEDHRNKFKNLDVNDCSFFTDTKTGQRFQPEGFKTEIKEGRLH